MVDMKQALKFIEKQIETFERNVFLFDNVVRPRYEADRKILDSLREQHLKLSALEEKMAKGEEVSTDDIYAAVPSQFR